MTELQEYWTLSLEAAADALAAASGAHTLPPGEVAARRRRLDLERAWLATVDWSRFGRRAEATVTLLEPPSNLTRPRLMRPAA
jgi:hypothetical protein